MIKLLVCCWAVCYNVIIQIFIKVIFAYSILYLDNCIVGWCGFNVVCETLVLLSLYLIVWCFLFHLVFFLVVVSRNFFLFHYIFIVSLMWERFCGFWFVFSTTQFSLNYYTFWSNVSLAPARVNLLFCSQCIHKFSISSLEWCSAT